MVESFLEFDRSRHDVRVRNVLKRLRIETVEELLALTEKDLLALRNCGSKTIEAIMRLQRKHSILKSADKGQDGIDRAVEDGRGYVNRLIGVAIAANGVVEGAKKDGRYYFRISRQRLNTLKRTLKEFLST